MPLTRRGTALAEAVVAAVLTAALVVSALGALSHLQRSVGRLVGRSLSDQSLRGAAQLLRSELRDLSPSAGELLALGPTSLTYRAVRATGIACGSAGGRVLVAASSWSQLRQPAAWRDSLVLLGQPGDTEAVVASSGAGVAGSCPDGVASVSLPYASGMPDPAITAAYPAPVLLSETMEIRAYQSAGEWWIGVRSVSAGEVIQPAHGPVASDGFRITALDSAGAATFAPDRVAHLSFVVKSFRGDSLELHLDYSRGVWR